MDLLKIVSDRLLQERIIEQPLQYIHSVSGGCINDCYRLEHRFSNFFVKVNHAEKFPNMFHKEANGLQLLRETNTIKIPNKVTRFEEQKHSFLVLEWIEKGEASKDSWFEFGQQLANLHQVQHDQFGLDEDNYIGSLPQKNNRFSKWHEFFFECRLLPQLELGIQQGWTSTNIFKSAENIAKVIEAGFPKEPPALLHGDLWSGNYLIDSKKHPVLIDPAVYFGNREMEIAFTQLFGGFDRSFYSHYNNFYPLQPNFKQRLEIHQLYPILVHANLFQGHYIEQALGVLKKF